VDTAAPSGNEAFDRARDLLAHFREDEALDWFEIAATEADEPAVRASAAAFTAGLLCTRGRPWEVGVWADVVRDNKQRPDLGNLLDAAAQLQLDNVDAARALLEHVEDPSDPWFPASATSALVARAHVAYIDGETERAKEMVLEAFAAEPGAPDVWDALARLCAETGFDPSDAVAAVPDDDVFAVLASLRASAPAGVDRIAELIWKRAPGDARVLALVPSFAPRLESTRALEWSARMRKAGMGRLCPLLDRAEDSRVGAAERARAAALAHASFGDGRARELIERAVPALSDDELSVTFSEVWALAPMLADSVVIAGATTPPRALRLASALFVGGAEEQAYTVLRHGLSLEAADELTTELVVALLPEPVIEGLAVEAEQRGDAEIAGLLVAVAVVAHS
jgi:hypothetical protein